MKKNLPVHFERAAVVLTSGPHQGDVFDLTFHDDSVAPTSRRATSATRTAS